MTKVTLSGRASLWEGISLGGQYIGRALEGTLVPTQFCPMVASKNKTLPNAVQSFIAIFQKEHPLELTAHRVPVLSTW